MKFNEYLKLIGYVLITFVIVWILALVSNKYFDVEIDSDTAIISFIGIIATFIVVGNYSQVAEMRNQALEQTNKYNAKIDEFNAKMKDIERLETQFNENQIKVFVPLYIDYYSKGLYPTAFYMILIVFRLFLKVTYFEHYNTTIEFLKSCIQFVGKSEFTIEKSKEIINISQSLKGKPNVDIKELDDLIEVVKMKNVEYGYVTN